MDLSTMKVNKLKKILADNGYNISNSRLYRGDHIVPGVVPIDKSSLIRFISDNKLNENVKTEDSNPTLVFLQKMYSTSDKCDKRGCVKQSIPSKHEVPRAISLTQNSSRSGGKRRKTNRRRKGTNKQKKNKTSTKRSIFSR